MKTNNKNLEKLFSFIGNDVPRDRFIYQEVFVPPSNIAFGLIVALDLVGCVLSLTFLFFNIYFRNNRYMSFLFPSPNVCFFNPSKKDRSIIVLS